MALMQNMWKLKGSLRPVSACKGQFVLGGQIRCLFHVQSSSPPVSRVPEFDSVTAAECFAPSHRSSGCSFFSEFYSGSCPTAGHRLSSLFPVQFQAFGFAKHIPRMFVTSAIQCPWRLGGRCCSIDVVAEVRVSNLEKVSEAGLLLLTGQNLGRFFSQSVKVDAPKQTTNCNISGLQQVWNDHRSSDKEIQMDTNGVVDVEACKFKPSVLASRRSYARALDAFGEAVEDSEVQGYPFGVTICVQGMILENGKKSLHLEFNDNCELRYLEDRSMNLDKEGVQHLNLRLLSGACCLPHPNKVKTGGEDAYFISSEEQVVGVADGVGGWADVGVDAGDYARELMLKSKLAAAQEPHGYIDPARVLIRAHSRTKCRGSSTACIIALSEYGLQAANLGDSGFVVMRNGRIICKSPVQQHQFNIPFQLENGGSDPPTSAEVFSLQVVSGDVLVAGTDGLFDNLYDNELIGIVTHSTRAGLDPQLTAHKIAVLARERAEDRNRQTPFSTAAQEAGFRFYGGKMDDITVIVSFVTTTKSDVSKLVMQGLCFL